MWKVGWSYVKVVLEDRDFERYRVRSSQRKDLLAPGRNASDSLGGDGNCSTYRSYDSANGVLMAASVEPIGARIYWKARKAVAFVSFLAGTEDFHP